MSQVHITLVIFILISLSACMAKKDTILPTRYDRETKIATYKQCVSQATNRGYDSVRHPDEIVRESMRSCIGAKNYMFKEYPVSWRKGLEKEVDEELYNQEITWILKNREDEK